MNSKFTTSVVAAAVLALSAAAFEARAQSNNMCQNPNTGTWQPCGPNNPMYTVPATGSTAAGNATVLTPLAPQVSNPVSTLTLSSATGAYGAGQLMANSASATGVVVPSFTITNSGGGIPRLRLSTNDATTGAYSNMQIQIDLWSAAPTFSNGDRGAFQPATGSANHLGAFTCVMPSGAWGDGLATECFPQVGNFPMPKLASPTIFWSAQTLTAGGATASGKTLTLTAEIQG